MESYYLGKLSHNRYKIKIKKSTIVFVTKDLSIMNLGLIPRLLERSIFSTRTHTYSTPVVSERKQIEKFCLKTERNKF